MLERKKFNVFENDNYKKLMELAETFYKSSKNSHMYKTKLTSVEKTFVILLHGLEVGLSSTQSIKNIDVLMETPGLNADAQLALARNSGELKHFEEYYIDKEGNKIENWPQNRDKIFAAVCVIKRESMQYSTTFYSYEEAKQKKLINKPNWIQFPERMLQLRARSVNIRDNFGDILAGLQHSVEELQDAIETNTNEISMENNALLTLELSNKPFSDETIEVQIANLYQHIIEKIDNIDSMESYDNCKIWYHENKKTILKFISLEHKDKICEKLREKQLILTIVPEEKENVQENKNQEENHFIVLNNFEAQNNLHKNIANV